MEPENILLSRVAFPETVFIVGTGPERQIVHDSIPENAFIIALNGAIEYKLPSAPEIWLVGDPAAMKTNYFKKNIRYLRTSGHDVTPVGIRPGCMTIPVFEKENICSEYPWVRCCYEIEKGDIHVAVKNNTPGRVGIGATIAGVAVQIAEKLGAKNIRLIGISMYGNIYHDGSFHSDSSRINKDWPQKDKFDWLVNLYSNNGISIRYMRDDVFLDSKNDPNINLDEPMQYKLFEQFIDLPREVVILGTGPKGKAAFDKIKPSDFVICVNGSIAIEHENIKPKVWILADGETPEKDYFIPGCERSNREKIKRVWSYAVRDRARGRKPHYIFPMVHDHIPGFRPVPDRVRPDATVVGIAIDICYRYGVKHIKLCGVDMSGSKYWDGSYAPGNVDDKHGEIWDMRDELDDEIWWMHDHGMRISTLSETKLREPHTLPLYDLPSVALMTMAFNPVFTKNAIFHAAIQDYPNHLKTLYLLTQNEMQPSVAHDLPFRIVQLDIEGKWPELWLWKLMRFFEVATEDYLVIFDEDDYFEPNYLSDGIEAILKNEAKMSWTFKNRFVTRKYIQNGNYRSAFGTIFVERELAQKSAQRIWWKCYEQHWEPGIKPPENYGGRGAQDMNFQHELIWDIAGIRVESNSEFDFGDGIVEHHGKRWYIYHRNANTVSGRLDEDCIDYIMPEIWYAGTRFENVREEYKFRHLGDQK